MADIYQCDAEGAMAPKVRRLFTNIRKIVCTCAHRGSANVRNSLYIKLRLFLAILARGHENLVQALGRYGGSVGVVTVDIEGLDLEQTSEKF